MGGEDYYLELCERPVQFEKANPVNCVFFDEANKQVFAVRSGGATGVVVKGPDDRNPISFRMDDRGEVKCIKFSLENKILAVQRTSKAVPGTYDIAQVGTELSAVLQPQLLEC